MEANLYNLIAGMWAALGVFWGVLWLAAAGRRADRVQSGHSRLAHLAIMAAAFWLLFAKNPGLGILSWHVWPVLEPIQYAGLGLTFAGLAFTAWARASLGRNWSAIVTIRRDHRLVRTGPYRWVRHPIYSGLLLAMLGTAICFGQLRGLVGLALGLAGFWMKARLEETFLIERFGAEYIQYKKDVKALIPLVL